MPGMTKLDTYLFHEGTHSEVYKKLGAHPGTSHGKKGVRFSLWAPNAQRVSVMTEGGMWDASANPMTRGADGVWTTFIPGVRVGEMYRYAVTGADGITRDKSDPYAFFSERRPHTASVVWSLKGYKWGDEAWQEAQDNLTVWEKPMAIYELHPGSWKREGPDPEGFLNYRALADQLAEYLTYMGYTHVELIGICEYPFDGSWGYQVTGFFSPTSRYGTPDDFRYFVDTMHRAGIGVILDWVPAHFPRDDFGLRLFDGTPLYESPDPLLAEYPEWGTNAFDHAKPEVRSFLISSAFYWIREFHIDALRMDAVAAMLYTSFGRREWRPNRDGGNENLDSIAFLRQLNHAVKTRTNAYVIAEDSSILPGITEDPEVGGMGFTLKWNMGWMNDTLRYIGKEPIYRGYHHELLTHTFDYAFLENYVLVLSHDEVVHLKRSMLMKAPGSMPDKFATLKTLYAYMFAHPGKKLLFMGQEFGEEREWSEARALDWSLADDQWHRDILDCVRMLLSIYRRYPALYRDPRDGACFEWINGGDAMRNTLSFIRKDVKGYEGALAIVCNFSPMQYNGYTFGAPLPGWYKRVFSTYDSLPGSEADIPPLTAREGGCDGRPYTLSYDLRPFETAFFALP